MGDETFAAIIRSIDPPMLVVTTGAGDERAGCLVGFHTQCSIDPVRWLVGISKANRTYDVVRRASTVVVHVLRADQLDLARLFGEATGDTVDKFRQWAWTEGPGGVPVLAGCDWFAGPIIERFDLGDHEGELVAVTHAGRGHGGGAQLGLQQVARLEPGHPA